MLRFKVHVSDEVAATPLLAPTLLNFLSNILPTTTRGVGFIKQTVPSATYSVSPKTWSCVCLWKPVIQVAFDAQAPTSMFVCVVCTTTTTIIRKMTCIINAIINIMIITMVSSHPDMQKIQLARYKHK